MTTLSTTSPIDPEPERPLGPFAWLRRVEHWLDSHGKGAWITAMVLGFILIWPIGLALLFYMIWGKRMFSGKCQSGGKYRHSGRKSHSSGNVAFDAYKAQALEQLEKEQIAFEAFLERLRAAKDKAEFDQFMEERKSSDMPTPEGQSA